jgi:hypothetical protein
MVAGKASAFPAKLLVIKPAAAGSDAGMIPGVHSQRLGN